jgi:hypothetical protein
VYGVFDPAGDLQFLGISRNVRASVEGHRRKVPADLCASVKVYAVTHRPSGQVSITPWNWIARYELNHDKMLDDKAVEMITVSFLIALIHTSFSRFDHAI